MLGGLLLLLPWTSLIGALVARRDVRRVHGQHDVRRSGEAVRVSSGVDVDLPQRAGRTPSHQLVRAESPGRAGILAALWLECEVASRLDRRAADVHGVGVRLQIYGGAEGSRTYGPGAPKSPLYGIWDVDSMSINGEARPPITTDTLRYSHVVFQALNGGISFQKMNQTFDRFGGTIDTVKRTLALTKGTDSTWKPVLAYERPSATRLMFEGDLGGKRVRLAMTQHDLNKFLLISRGFHWVQEFPINR